MNEKLERLGALSGILNYVDNETPRVYFVDGYADYEDVEEFAKMIINKMRYNLHGIFFWIRNTPSHFWYIINLFLIMI